MILTIVGGEVLTCECLLSKSWQVQSRPDSVKHDGFTLQTNKCSNLSRDAKSGKHCKKLRYFVVNLTIGLFAHYLWYLLGRINRLAPIFWNSEFKIKAPQHIKSIYDKMSYRKIFRWKSILFYPVVWFWCHAADGLERYKWGWPLQTPLKRNLFMPPETATKYV